MNLLVSAVPATVLLVKTWRSEHNLQRKIVASGMVVFPLTLLYLLFPSIRVRLDRTKRTPFLA